MSEEDVRRVDAGADAGVGASADVGAGASANAIAGGAEGAAGVTNAGGAASVDAAAGRSEADASAGASPAKASRLRLFLRASVLDLLLVLVVSVGLVFTISYAFESVPDIRGNVLIDTALVLPMLVILFAGSWSKRALAPSAVAAVVYAVVVIGVCVAMKPADVPLFVDNQVNDVAENPLIFGFIAMAVPAVTYLLSRRRTGMIVLFVVAVVACGAVQFLYRDWTTNEPGLACSLIVLLACGALFVYQGYRRSIYQVKRLEKTAFAQAAAFAAGIVGVCLLISVGLFYGVISPLGLTTPEIKPFEDYYTRPVIEYSGVYDESQVDNPDLATNQTNDEQNDSNQDAEGGRDNQSPEENQETGGNPISNFIQQMMSFDSTDWDQQFMAISYEQLRLGALVFGLLLVAAIVAAVLLKRWWREQRLKKLEGESYSVRIWTLYEFLTNRFARLGIKRPETLTLMEFAMATRSTMAPFARGTGGVDFLELTLVYQRACYDEGRITEDDWRSVERFYRAFFGNARTYVGKVRWLRDFWRM